MRAAMSFKRKLLVVSLGIFTLCTAAVSVVQGWLYMHGFEQVLGGVQTSTMDIKRRSAEDLLREIRISTEKTLQPGEYKQFIEFAAQQKDLKEVEEFSFIGDQGKVELSSRTDRVGTAMDAATWAKVKASRDIVVTEDQHCFSMFYPLRVSADLKRLSPEWQVDAVYGALYLKFSKEQVNQALSTARTSFEANSRRTVGIVTGLTAAGLAGTAMLLSLLLVRPLTRTLGAIIQGLSGSSKQLVEVSDNMSSASKVLAEGASNQASSLEETSSAMEEMAAMTRSTAGDAQKAESLAGQSKDAAHAGEGTVVKLNEAMTGITQSSEKIARIIKVIEEIAFQTNLLALNAAVEAARAGEHGKGFAVVADEVRNLAQRAGQAAGETRGLIEDAVTRARQGMDVAGQVGTALGTIVTDVTKVTSLVVGIAQASQQQAQGVEQVNTALSEMDKITQQNAAGAENAATAAGELTEHARSVETIVGQLTQFAYGGRG